MSNHVRDEGVAGSNPATPTAAKSFSRKDNPTGSIADVVASRTASGTSSADPGNGIPLFHVIDDAAVILKARGVYRQAKVYRRGTDVFAAWGAGFIRLLGSHGTTLPNVSWLDLQADGVSFPSRNLGRPQWGAGE